jgi:hypothetical protein
VTSHRLAHLSSRSALLQVTTLKGQLSNRLCDRSLPLETNLSGSSLAGQPILELSASEHLLHLSNNFFAM